MNRASSSTATLLPLFTMGLTMGLATASVAQAADLPPSHPITPEAPWAGELDDEMSKSLVEQWYGPEVAEAWQDIEPHWEGTQLLTRDSFDDQMMAALGVPPVPAMNYEASPGVVYVAMNGITLTSSCGNGDTANGARKCTPLVSGEVTFPPFTEGNAGSEFQQLRAYYEPFDIVMTSAEPPEWLPYTLTVIGGSSALAGLPGSTCGVANVACDGLKRNHVSLNFPQSCGGMAETAGQETAHNWGLEHTDVQSDLLYPFNTGGSKSFRDECMNISDATGNGITQCGYIHEIYCPDGGGEQQNSYAEMMGVFGPKSGDDVPPEITSVFPPDGAIMDTTDAFTVSAHIEENSRTLGVKWTWLENLPPGFDSYTRCTNNVCDNDFNPGVSFNAGDMEWDFVNVDNAPEGIYRFQIEALDVYGNYDKVEFEFEVREGGDPGGGLDETGGGGGSGDGTAGDTGLPGGTGDAGGLEGGDDGDPAGCNCRTEDAGSPWSLGAGLGMLLLGLRRRRRVA